MSCPVLASPIIATWIELSSNPAKKYVCIQKFTSTNLIKALNQLELSFWLFLLTPRLLWCLRLPFPPWLTWLQLVEMIEEGCTNGKLRPCQLPNEFPFMWKASQLFCKWHLKEREELALLEYWVSSTLFSLCSDEGDERKSVGFFPFFSLRRKRRQQIKIVFPSTCHSLPPSSVLSVRLLSLMRALHFRSSKVFLEVLLLHPLKKKLLSSSNCCIRPGICTEIGRQRQRAVKVLTVNGNTWNHQKPPHDGARLTPNYLYSAPMDPNLARVHFQLLGVMPQLTFSTRHLIVKGNLR